MNNRDIYQTIADELREGRPVVQATVIQTKGSTPRKEGSTMLVKQDGKLVGTIGGGCGEAGVISKCRLSLMDGDYREEHADLTEDISTESEGVCGGTLRVFIEPWQPGTDRLELAEHLRDLADGSEQVVVHQVVESEDPDQLGRRYILGRDGQPVFTHLPNGLELPAAPERKPHQIKRAGKLQFYTERWDPTPTLVVVGAGHVAEPLDAVGRMAGFRTVVVDDRHLFANRERFPEADQVICGPILEVMRRIDLSPHHYLVLVTRGHTLDMDALRVLTERQRQGEQVAYVGMIGSKRRVGAVFQLLEEEGYPRHLFDNVYAPIGLNIGAETPAEIGVAVLAEMIAVRRHNGDDTRHLRDLSGMHPALRRGDAPAKAAG